MPADPGITELLAGVRAGDAGCRDRLVEAVYHELKRMARQQLRGERAGHSIQPSALVNDLYIRMLGRDSAVWENRAHFFALAAVNMRQILTDHARAHTAKKRAGGNKNRVDIEDALRVAAADGAGLDAERLIQLDDALTELATLDARAARIVELRFYTGLTNEEVAQVLGVVKRTVIRDWEYARGWLKGKLRDGGAA